MRLLLIAYDFPPIPSPQALRWAYLAREIARQGHDIHVLAPDVLGYGKGGLPESTGVTVHRVWPGPLMGRLVRRQRLRAAHAADNPGDARTDQVAPGAGPIGTIGLNWKGRLFERLNAVLGWILFPDIRAEWAFPARKALQRLLADLQPDVVITSHEPPVSIPLGLLAKRMGFSWVADLGDPILAPYTAHRWRRRARGLERALCREADWVTVTSQRTLETLQARHGSVGLDATVITQGYDADCAAASANGEIHFDADTLEILYTGSFYSFRRPDALFRAVLNTPGSRLSIATMNPPPEVTSFARAHPDKIRLLGFLGHGDALALQRRCDLLVNIANDDPIQVPGKIYEYLGSGKPILHVTSDMTDAASDLLRATGAGTISSPEYLELTAALQGFASAKSAGHPVIRPAKAGIEQYSWQSLAVEFLQVCTRVSGSKAAA